MGKGAYAAHATYNGTGTQGLATTDKYEEYETRSVFIMRSTAWSAVSVNQSIVWFEQDATAEKF